jgi:hypothetical protein
MKFIFPLERCRFERFEWGLIYLPRRNGNLVKHSLALSFHVIHIRSHGLIYGHCKTDSPLRNPVMKFVIVFLQSSLFPPFTAITVLWMLV